MKTRPKNPTDAAYIAGVTDLGLTEGKTLEDWKRESKEIGTRSLYRASPHLNNIEDSLLEGCLRLCLTGRPTRPWDKTFGCLASLYTLQHLFLFFMYFLSDIEHIQDVPEFFPYRV